ncbi:YiiD C-terminal domain-containing protein [Lysobacter sp. SG-8]|uniref:YiiD C-terminal domain-containing protein n=1 Tax=Marilutibacter penaei TaxID=2759900 RepID=A0A7W3YDD9_9GAMM|nr:YiiD C-terminal domain-containing protein [Lysobacter penaei]MBB1087273.1 YiiD C-terminal domain-containing protein [Lysobacter penaei]
MPETAPAPAADPLARLASHYASMPPVAAMDIRVDHYDGRCLRVTAPLERHVNDKGCAFGGSLASLMTLGGWGLVSLQVEAAGLDADIYVADSQIGYLRPLFADLTVEAEAGPHADWDAFMDMLRARGRARIHVVAHARLPEGGAATEFAGRYVAILRR